MITFSLRETDGKNLLIGEDTRTGVIAGQFIGNTPMDFIKKSMEERFEYEFQKSLPPEKRDICNKSTDFNCPFCLKNTKVSRRYIRTEVFFVLPSIDLYINHCHECSNDFSDEDLDEKILTIKEENRYNLQFEKAHEMQKM